MDSPSNGKIVVVTGASSGFGAQISTLLASRGYRVYGTSRIAPKVPDDLSPGGRNYPSTPLQMLQLDVTSDSSVRSLVEQLSSEQGRIDVLINNAGYVLTGAAEETSIEEGKAEFETNFFGVVRMTNAVLPAMRRQRSGRIMNI